MLFAVLRPSYKAEISVVLEENQSLNNVVISWCLQHILRLCLCPDNSVLDLYKVLEIVQLYSGFDMQVVLFMLRLFYLQDEESFGDLHAYYE